MTTSAEDSSIRQLIVVGGQQSVGGVSIQGIQGLGWQGQGVTDELPGHLPGVVALACHVQILQATGVLAQIIVLVVLGQLVKVPPENVE